MIAPQKNVSLYCFINVEKTLLRISVEQKVTSITLIFFKGFGGVT